MFRYHFFFGFFWLLIVSLSCTKNPDSPGIEYMPDMYRSAAVEAYIDYQAVDQSVSSARLPVPGTIPFSFDKDKIMFNFPFDYASPKIDPTAYERVKELKNPLPITLKNREKGQILYNKFCVSCHGVEGQGDGKVVEWGNFPSPGAYNKKYKHLTEGQIFYSITYGKGLMGAHGSVLTKEERWQLVQYVQSLINR